MQSINKNPIPAGALFPQLGAAITIKDKKCGTTTIVSKEEYKEIRKQLINAFDVGNYSAYYGRYCNYNELGDLQLKFKDIIRKLTKTRFHPDHPIDYPTRLSWRNALLYELDTYVSM